MKVGILTWNKESWSSTQLETSLTRLGVSTYFFNFRDLMARIGCKPEVQKDEIDLYNDLDAVIVRPIGRGSLEEIVFRMDLLHRLQRLGLYTINSPAAIERSVDKFHSLSLLEEAGLPVPLTIITERADRAIKAFKELGSDVVIKPIFGSRGIGSTRVSDVDVAERIFRALEFHHQVIYLQEYMQHGGYDLRIFVLGGKSVASMKRVADSWKTNISLGAKPKSYKPPKMFEQISEDAAETIGCEIAGIDILDTKEGPFIIELNSQPGWKGLQSVTKINIADTIASYVLCVQQRNEFS